MIKTKKQDFVQIVFTGYHDGKPFDSNRPEDLKKLNPNSNADTDQKTIVIVGEKMVVSGFDTALENKEIGKEYEIHLPYKEAFGPRKREFVKTIPLRVFTEQKINPSPGQTLFLDNMLARVITVSGARVVTDFNNPLAGKDLDYKFEIVRIITDEREKCDAFFKFFFKLEKPEFEIEEKKVIVKGPKPLEPIIDMYKEKFKEIFKKDLEFELEKEKPEKFELEKEKPEKSELEEKKPEEAPKTL